MYRILSLLICVTFACNLQGQSWFDVQTDLFDKGHSFSGTPVAVVDMNNDFLDDVVYLDQGVQLNIAYQQYDRQQFVVSDIGTAGREPQWSLVVFDLDRNGLRDIIIAGAYDDVKIYYQETDSFRLVKHPIPDIYAQAMNGVDINGDGWTDLFLCNDIGYNQVWWNEQGILRRDTTGMFTDLPEERNSGNYGSEWSDIDNDGDLDLYVAKCNANASSPSDLRRINRLYIQQEDGTFTEEAEIRGVASGAQSWTGHFADLNNDGSEDLLITNHDQRAEVYHNDGNGFFQDQTNRSGTRIVGPVIQSLAVDFNLDQKKDIIIGGVPDYLYEQKEGDRFLNRSEDLSYYNLTSFATGDLNADNLPDIFATVGMLINLPSSMRDRIMYNNLSEVRGHSVWLQGTNSNPDGIGAKVLVYIDGVAQSKVVKSGESYGIQNSYTHLFCGHTTDGNSIDSIVVKWPSGQEQTINNIESSQSMFIENTDAFGLYNQQGGRVLTVCSGDSVQVNFPQNADTVWVNGKKVSSPVYFRESGYYSVQAHFAKTGAIDLPGFIIQVDPVPAGNIEITEGDAIGCEGSFVTLAVNTSNTLDLVWSDGNNQNPRTITVPGEYTPILLGGCKNKELLPFEFKVVSPQILSTTGDSIRKGDTAVIIAKGNGNILQWFANALDSAVISTNDTLTVPDLQMDSSFYVSTSSIVDFPIKYVGIDKLESNKYYHEHNLNGTMIFEVHRPTTFVSTMVYATFPGRRSIILLDRNLDEYARKEVDLDTGWTKILLNIDLFQSGGPYRLTTDDRTNRVYLGTRSPQLASSNMNITYPYTVPDLITIITSQYGNGSYDYFYNWEVKPADLICESTRQRVEVIIKNTTLLTDLMDQYINIWPNPSSGIVAIEIPRDMDGFVEWYSLQGRRIFPLRIDFEETGENLIAKYRFLNTGVKMLRVGKKTWPVLVRK